MNIFINSRIRQYAPLVVVLISATIAVAAYLQALNAPFLSDDLLYIVFNKKIAELHYFELWRLLVEPYNPSFEFLPLRDLSFWIDIALFGQNPAAFRLHNILLYLLCLPLVYAITASFWRYCRPLDAASAPWVAAVVTALFALHPALVESVVWVSGRKYILPNFFSLLAIWLAFKVKRDQGFSSNFALATLVALVAVMFSKSSYVGVAAVISLLWIVFWLDIPAQQRHRSLLLWPLASLLVATFLLMIFIVKNQAADSVPFYFGIEAVTRSLAVLGGLARIAISPEARHFTRPVFEDPWFPSMVAFGALVLGVVGWGFVMCLRKRSLAGLALTTFFLLCIPYLQIIPGKPPSLVADRYVALAILPAILLFVALLWRFKPPLRAALVLLIAAPWLYQTLERPRDWRNDATLVDVDFRTYPEYYLTAFYKISYLLRDGLHYEASVDASHIASPDIRNAIIKLVYADQVSLNDVLSSGNPNEAIRLFQEIEPLLDQHPVQAKWNAELLFIRPKLILALSEEWNSLAEKFPKNVTVRYNTGQYLFNMKYFSEASTHLRVVAESKDTPEYARGTVFKTFGLALLGSGQLIKSEAALRAALAQTPPDLEAYCGLTEVFAREGRFEESAHAKTKCSGSPFDEPH